METYIIKVNGTTYEVEVEKKEGASGAASPVASDASGQTPTETAATAAPAAAVQSASPANVQGEPAITGTAGKVWKIVTQAGDSVKRGDNLLILEAMKMEIPVVAPKDGKVGSILVSEGDAVVSGQTVATVI